jgi:hypothetical protein
LATFQVKDPPVAVPEPYVRYYRFYCSELIERTNGANGVKVGGETLAEDEGHGRILGGVGDGVALAGRRNAC